MILVIMFMTMAALAHNLQAIRELSASLRSFKGCWCMIAPFFIQIAWWRGFLEQYLMPLAKADEAIFNHSAARTLEPKRTLLQILIQCINQES